MRSELTFRSSDNLTLKQGDVGLVLLNPFTQPPGKIAAGILQGSMDQDRFLAVIGPPLAPQCDNLGVLLCKVKNPAYVCSKRFGQPVQDASVAGSFSMTGENDQHELAVVGMGGKLKALL